MIDEKLTERISILYLEINHLFIVSLSIYC